MTRIRHGERIWEIHDDEWPRWVQLGWVPADALVLSERWTKGVWRQADSLEVYHLFRPSPGAQAAPLPEEKNVRRHGPFGIFRGPGPSVTELLVLANVLVGILLYVRWGEDYSTHLWAYSARLEETLESGGIQVLFIPLFLHADFGHLSGNMLTFVLAGAVIEEFYGRLRMFTIYIGAGLSGALLSLMREKDVLSVGASGAILGMYGAGLVFLLRERGYFNASQRYRLKRVQIPFFLLMVIPAILYADFFAHLGGFLGGMLLGWMLPPLADRLPRRPEVPAEVPVEAPAELATIVPFPVQPPIHPSRIIPFPQKPRLHPSPTPLEDGGEVAGPELQRPDEGTAGGPDR